MKDWQRSNTCVSIVSRLCEYFKFCSNTLVCSVALQKGCGLHNFKNNAP